MPFSFTPKSRGDLIKSQDWNEAMSAIVALFEKFNQATGHRHTGATEDAPAIQQNGIADNAVAESKLQNGAVTQDKIGDLAISTAKIQDGAVTETKIQNGAVTTAKIGNLAVSTAQIQDGAVTLSKIAPDAVSPNIGITVTQGLTNGVSVPIPTGFTKAECVFFAIPKFINTRDVNLFVCQINTENPGVILATPEGNITATGVAIAKKGGW